jgi:hypothetical protein
MANKRFLMGILIITLVLGMAVIGCDDGSTGGGMDLALNVTWVDPGSSESFEITFNNGNFQKSIYGYPTFKGTYTTNDGRITEKTPHLWGGSPRWAGILESKWYPKAELRALGVISDEQLEEMFSDASPGGPYYVSGNKLTWAGIIYTKK